MARPKDQFYEQRRAVIIDVAAKLIAEHGFHGASISDLAELCKISKSLIYHYYGSKEDILFEIIKSHLEKLSAVANEVASADTPPSERLVHLIHSFMQIYAGAGDRQKVVLNELGNLPPDKRAEAIADQRRIISVVEEILSGLRPDRDDSAQRRRAVAMLLFGMINWTHIWFKPDGALSVDELAEMSGKLVLEGVKGLL